MTLTFILEKDGFIAKCYKQKGIIHILCNVEGWEGGLTKRYHCVFLLFKSIKILTESVT